MPDVKTVSLDHEVVVFIEEYRRKQENIPTFSKAINDLLTKCMKKEEDKK